jgi:transposase
MKSRAKMTVGLDLAKHVFQVHCVDALGRVVVAKPIRRNKLLEFFASLPRCLVGLEASGSAHHWARELIALGHEARISTDVFFRLHQGIPQWTPAICILHCRSFRFHGVDSCSP